MEQNENNADGDDQNGDDMVDDNVGYENDYYYHFYVYGGNQEYLLNVIDYSLKYVRCQSIKTYSDDLAQDMDTDTVLMTHSFVAICLCHLSYCNNDNNNYLG